MAQIYPKITIRPVVNFGMLLLVATVMILTVRLTIASELDSLKTAAEQGDAAAQFNLGLMYSTGEGVPRNYTEATRWYRMAAEQGFAEAQVYLGLMYLDGRSVPRNYTEAVRWFRMAAEQGFAEAQFLLGNMYDTGEGVPQNDTEAARWYRMVAEQGNVWGQAILGFRYSTGRGVPKDYVQAYAWLNIAAAAAQGDEPVKGFMEDITKEMTSTDITKAQELSREYWKAYGPNRASSE